MKVLFATDGAGPAMKALSLLERVASPRHTEVTVVTVSATGSPDESEGLASGELLESAVTRLKAAGFKTDQRVLEGRPAAKILEAIDDGGFELTVMGAGNRSRLGRILMGSVSTKVLHASPSSALIVHQVSDLEHPVRVLFGTDSSKYAERALDQMATFLEPSSCEIEVVSVGEHLMPVISFPAPGQGYATGAPTPEVEKEWMDAATEFATKASTKLEGAGFKTSAKARLGAPAIQLLDEMDEIRADLVVVGSAGLGAVGRATLGSVSDQMVRHAPATLVVRG